MIALGRADDVRGFALAGVETARCDTPDEARRLVLSLGADATVGLVLVPAWIGHAAGVSIASVRNRRRAAIVLVLPENDLDA
jgi:vacuolar-type H+-ATPase subunit F/Vma7